jgi:hypothetical protein
MRNAVRRLALVAVLLVWAGPLAAQTVAKSFTAVGDGPDLLVNTGDTVTYSQSGTFVGTTILQQIIAGGAVPIVTATGASSGSFVAQARANDAKARYRYRATAYTSGTIVTSLIGTPQLGTGAGTPGGSNTQIQYNNNGIFAGSPNLTWNEAMGGLAFGGSGSPALTLTNGLGNQGLLYVNASDSSLTLTEYDNANPPPNSGDLTFYPYSHPGPLGGAWSFQDQVRVGGYNGNPMIAEALYVAPGYDGAATKAAVIGAQSYVSNLSTGTITQASDFWAGAPVNSGGGTVTTHVAFYGVALGGTATNAYSFWSDEQGVYRIKGDNTFNAVYQAIPALYNPQFTKYTAGAANYERIVFQWESNAAVLTTEKGGTGTLRNLQLGDAGVHVQVTDLKTTGAATGKKTVCVDTTTGQLYASSTGTDCSN